MATQPTSIWKRKTDLLYMVFFVIHVPIMLSVDLSPYYPTSIRPIYTVKLHAWYAATYRDRFFTAAAPLWFHSFLALEVIYHIPLSLWVVPALLRDDVLVPLHLLCWAVETALTTLVCCLEVWSWKDRFAYELAEVVNLEGLYVGYLILALFMVFDMFFRVKRQVLLAKTKTQ